MEETTFAAHAAAREACAEADARRRVERLVADDGRPPATLEDVLIRVDDARLALVEPGRERLGLLVVEELARDLAAVIRRTREAGASTALGPTPSR